MRDSLNGEGSSHPITTCGCQRCNCDWRLHKAWRTGVLSWAVVRQMSGGACCLFVGEHLTLYEAN
jgi:hypothetical protein